MRAKWQNTIVAESDKRFVVDGNHCFSPESIKGEYLQPSVTRTTCSWKGRASYDHLEVGQKSTPDAAWCYPEPKDAAHSINGDVAFWRDVKVAE